MNIKEPISNLKLVEAIEGLSNNNATQQKFFTEGNINGKNISPAGCRF